MYIKNKRGQSTVEYVLLVTAVVAVIIAFVTTNNAGGFKAQLNSTLNTATQGMGAEADILAASHPTTNAAGTGGTPSYSVAVTP